jgi:hypothetical protein
MSQKPAGSDTFGAQAEEQEKVYDWLEASESYRKAIGLTDAQDFSALGGRHERMGYAIYRAAMQSETPDAFKAKCADAIESYRKAAEFYKKSNRQIDAPKAIRCEAMIAYVRYWLAEESAEKKRLIDECWKLTKESLELIESLGSDLEYGSTFNQLSSSSYFSFALEWDISKYGVTIKEAVDRGEKAIAKLLNLDKIELAKSYVRTNHFLFRSAEVLVADVDEKLRLTQKAKDYLDKAIKLSEKNALLELVCIPNSPMFDIGETIVYYEKALEFVRETRDRFLVGSAMDILAYCYFWKSLAMNDPAKKAEIAEDALQMIDDSKLQFLPLSYVSPRGGAGWSGQAYAEYHLELATGETDLERRRKLLEKAAVEGAGAVELAEKTGYSEIVVDSRHVLSRVLASLALLVTDPAGRRLLLEKALEHRKETARLSELGQPFAYWNIGVMWNALADLQCEIAGFLDDAEKKKAMLEEAVLNKEKALQSMMKEEIPLEKRGVKSYLPMLGRYQYAFGQMLNQSYALGKNIGCQKRAIEVFEESAATFAKIGLTTRVAECRWRIAEAFHTLGEYAKACENFAAASAAYEDAGQNIPQFKALFQGFAHYMDAWVQIEKARQHHTRQEYDLATKYYEKAAETHKSLRQWNYMAPNYLAWAALEHAEDLSRKEKNEQAVKQFRQAINLFDRSNATLKTAVDKIQNAEERKLATNLIKATETRIEYCNGRIVLEEAKIQDKKGNHSLSSEKFNDAGKTFRRIAGTLDSEPERKDLALIATLSEAWQKMTQAETDLSPHLYAQASELFQEAKDLSSDNKTKTLTMGHHHFCRALQAGTEFVDTKNIETWNTAIQELDTAGNYYKKAEFETASKFTDATRLLFEAYVYIDKAKKETDPERKAKIYIMTEKVLESSAEHFRMAEHPEKQVQARALMKEIEKEKEFALSLVEVMHTPLITSTTSFPVPSPTFENAVGSERFEHANVQANVKAAAEIEVGEQLEVFFDLVNIGNNQGLLVRLDDVSPSGTKISSLTPQYEIEDGSINLRGKKIEPSKIESIKMNLQTTKAGVISLRPQVVYVDDLGKFRTGTLEPVNVSVHPKVTFEFRTKEAEGIFNFLVCAFVDDYMKRKITLEKSGWRTLNEIVKHGSVPKSSVYGVGQGRGRDISELERRGIVESRVFQGERGRGGNIVRVRVPYDKETIKRYIDERVMKNK